MQTKSKEDIENYFSELANQVQKAYDIAENARKKGYDPVPHIEIPLAKNMAERVEGLISAVIPQIINSGLSLRINELEKKYKKSDWRIALTIALEVSQEKFCKFKDKIEAMETGIRVGLAYLTLGIVSSPLEGFVQLKLKKRKDGKEYFCLMYSGPIRSAGGTAGAVSVILADYIRIKNGYEAYDPTDEEIKRMITEIHDYHERVTNLQYLPSEKEIEFLIKHLPVQIDGDPSEKIEVSNYKDLPRIETNQIRSGPCLVIGECVAQKGSKLWANMSKWKEDFSLENWFFLKDFLELQKKVKSKVKEGAKGKIAPVYTFIEDLVAGRPVLTYPLAVGGFRLRYGRCRTSGYSAAAINPLTMAILDKYIAIGTQLKVERPGKAAALSACDTIEGPIVKLANGNVVKIKSSHDLSRINNDIKEILFLGDILFSYGDFFNRAHQLLPAGYCEEWWALELEREIINMFGSLDLENAAKFLDIKQEVIEIFLKNPLTFKPDLLNALNISSKLRVPLHPDYIFHWNTISRSDLLSLTEWLNSGKIISNEGIIEKIILSMDDEPKRILEILGVEHIVVNNEFVVIEKENAASFSANLHLNVMGSLESLKAAIKENPRKSALEIINMLSNYLIRDKSGVFIGARMGRPEKAKMRKLTGSPHVLFPVGNEGGRLRSFQSCLEAGKIKAEFQIYKCNKCDNESVFSVCEDCGSENKKLGVFREEEIDIKKHFNKALIKISANSFPDLVKGVRGTSNKEHIPEHLVKGILRAKYDVYVNKDGTTRYDMTQLPITHFKPKEIMASVEMIRNLGYTQDIFGNDLTDSEQILELKPQDLILPSCNEAKELGADKVLFNMGNFMDELLEKLYGVEKFYNFKSENDVSGALIIALAPHTSAGIVGRVIGFSKTQAMFAHPVFHAATRRDCDGDEASIILMLDGILNFSRKFLPNSRGATQDAPLVLSSKIIPSEVDDMVFDMDVAWRYPLEFYEACSNFKNPWEVKIEQLGNFLNTERQYKFIGFTHYVENINNGVRCSAYKILPSMEEKLKGQLRLADLIRAVDATDVARLVIEKHFLRDIKGNLRKFSTQQFRCVNCNEKYRRPPLLGKCVKCDGNILFTVTEGSIIKYLEPAISLAKKYNLPNYLKQTLELTKRNVESIFGKEKEKQVGLGAWFG